MSQLLRTAAGVLVAIVIAAAVTLGTVALIQNGQQQTVACRQVNKLRTAIVAVLTRSEDAAARNPYYVKHPKLLADAQQQYASLLNGLGPIQC